MGWWQERKEKRKEQLRIKNAKLRAEGKEPARGHQMVDTGMGGLNKDDPAFKTVFPNAKEVNYYAEQQKQLADKNIKK